MDTVLLTVENRIATITLNRPTALNALNTAMRQDLVAIWKQVRRDDAIRVGIVTGAGRAFCAGLDMKEAAPRGRPSGSGSGYDLSYLPLEVPKPLIAAVNGAAAGGGLGLALSCDFAIAAEEAFFTAPFAARGTLNAPILALLLQKVPAGWAMWMNLSSIRVDAQTALRIGLVNEVLSKEKLLERAYEMAERITANSFVSVLAIKEKLRQLMDLPPREALAREGPYAKAWAEQGESAEGFAAFTEKRRPQFE